MNIFKEQRLKNGLSQEDVAVAVGVTRQAVCQWEKGGSYPRGETLLKVAELYHCTTDELLRGENHDDT